MECRGNFKQFSANSLYEPVPEAFDLSSPFQPNSQREVVGSCNGLLCLSAEFSIPGNDDGYYCRELHLWNPSTRICKELPIFGVNAYDLPRGISAYGFGYDKSSDDYKVVRFFHDDVNLPESEAMLRVYSLRNDEWKTVNNCVKPCWFMEEPAAFVDGKLYWLGTERFDPTRDLYLVCFDLETEEYETLQLPDCIKSDRMKWLVEFGGSLMVMSTHQSGSDVWIMDACNGNWAKVVTIPKIERYWWCCDLVLYEMNSSVMFHCGTGRSIVIYDAKDCSFRYPKIGNSGDFTVCATYIESLVSPLG